jgi:hypothetical protein
MAKRKKKRVKREPPAPTWVVFKCFNQTKEEVCFGISTNCPKWQGSRYELSRIPELAHWNIYDDKIMILRIGKRTRYTSPADATRVVQYFERTYDHWRNFWVVQTGNNVNLTPRERKPVKVLPPPRDYFLGTDMEEEDMDEEDVDEDDVDDNESED